MNEEGKKKWYNARRIPWRYYWGFLGLMLLLATTMPNGVLVAESMAKPAVLWAIIIWLNNKAIKEYEKGKPKSLW